jgi:NADH pyrophosphatase NudC (nudix superfamily)
MMKYCPTCKSDLLEKKIDQQKRLCCTNKNCDFVFWNNPTPVLAALVEHENKIIMARNKAWPTGIFSVITGFMEKGETPESGVLREVTEELGLNGTSAELIGVYAFLQMNQVIIAYHVKAEGDIALGEELLEIKMVDKNRLKGWSFGTGLAVTDWVNKHHQQ